MTKKNLNELMIMIRQVKSASGSHGVGLIMDSKSLTDLLAGGFPVDSFKYHITTGVDSRIVIVPAVYLEECE